MHLSTPWLPAPIGKIGPGEESPAGTKTETQSLSSQGGSGPAPHSRGTNPWSSLVVMSEGRAVKCVCVCGDENLREDKYKIQIAELRGFSTADPGPSILEISPVSFIFSSFEAFLTSLLRLFRFL